MPTPDPNLELQALRLKALGHASRLAILRAVVQGATQGTAVGDIQARLEIPPSTLSHHLSELAQAGLLKPTRIGTTILYAACYDTLRTLTEYLWQDCCRGGGWDPDCPCQDHHGSAPAPPAGRKP